MKMSNSIRGKIARIAVEPVNIVKIAKEVSSFLEIKEWDFRMMLKSTTRCQWKRNDERNKLRLFW